MPSELLTQRHLRTLVLTLSEPSTRNALSPQACAAGIEALGVAESDAAVRCVVLRGAGAHFCAGADLRELAQHRAQGDPAGRDAQLAAVQSLHGLVEALRSFPKPVVAAVEGHAAGAGFALALACDLVIAAEDARFTMSHGQLGLSPDGGASWHLAQRLPRAQALRLLWLPEALTARQVEHWGLVTHVVDSGQAFDEALRWADRLAAMAPGALASAKELLELAAGRSLREQLDAEARHVLDNLFGPHGAEGLHAFLDGRAPRFG
jgi:enoyl-CoA hydratase/carnithine racemase